MLGRGGCKESARGGRAIAFAVTILAALAIAGCGAKDFPNDPRPPVPKEITAKISGHDVVVSPDRFGAGLVVFTVANISGSPQRFVVSGPTNGSTAPIEPGGNATLKMVMEKGSYRAKSGGGLKPQPIAVGPTRKSAQNKLLLP